MKKIILAFAAVASLSAHAVEPTLVQDGEHVTMIGSIRLGSTFGVQDGMVVQRKAYFLTPRSFVITRPGQNSPESFIIDPKDDSVASAVTSSSIGAVSAQCEIKVLKSQPQPTCVLTGISEYREPVVEPAYMRGQAERTEAASMKSFDPSTTGKVALVEAPSVTGSAVIPRAAMISLLYPSRPCDLPVANARNMKKAEFLLGMGLVGGCWGKVLSPTDDKIVTITKFGDIRSGSLTSYQEAMIKADGSAEVIGPAMSMSKYIENVRKYHDSMR